MTPSFAGSSRILRSALRAILLLALVWPATGAADALADLHGAVQDASAQYRIAMRTLESSSREQSAAEVQRFRGMWQAVMDQFGANRPADFANDEEFLSVFIQIDTLIVGVLLVIDLGSREAAREALGSIEEILLRLQARSAPPG
jgi:hypothetical protein